MWAYEKTKDGTLYFNVTLDCQEENKNIHRVTQVAPIDGTTTLRSKSLQTAKSQWLRTLIDKGFEFSTQ